MSPSANADPGTPGYYAWQAHLARQLEHKNTHMSAHDAIYGCLAIDYGCLAFDIARIHSRARLLQPNVGIRRLYLQTGPGAFALVVGVLRCQRFGITTNGRCGPRHEKRLGRAGSA
jgi:hypothetical protein